MSKLIYFIKQSWLLVLASLFFGLILAVAEGALAPRIAANIQRKLDELCKSLISEAERFEPIVEDVEVTGSKGKTLTTTIYRGVNQAGQVIGYTFIAEGPGFADKIQIVIAVDKDFDTFQGFDVLASNETPGFGDKIKETGFRNQFVQAPAGVLELIKVGDPALADSEIVAISGATVSSEAVVGIFNTYVDSIKNTLVTEGHVNGN